ncbi:MAG: hypothetical protein E5X67_21050 [Mesorhizobium sp.]|uniref:hypothetical protein n=1 Tax=Mesorhizobium sp. TaxID=1871066 RepID=UPI0011F82AB6|nr:hypothetical protein [Mesorhizobium sp.]TIP26251.1 MAG: hypothetical protein E5X67_21050 [Mesorhizobium sp.]
MPNFVNAFWNSLTPEMQTTIVGVLAAAFSTVVGAMLVIWQIGRQANHAILQNRNNAALKLKVELYEEIVQLCHDASEASTNLASYIRRFNIDLGLFSSMTKVGQNWNRPKARAEGLMAAKDEFDKMAIKLMYFTEQWGIIDPRTSIFRTAVSVTLHDLELAFQPYFSKVLPWMPRGADNEVPGFLWHSPDDRTIAEIADSSVPVIDDVMNLESYVIDMQTEMQNLLLGDLFKHRLPARAPLDPTRKVLRLENYDKLNDHFNNATAWGQKKKETEAIVLQQNAARSVQTLPSKLGTSVVLPEGNG